MTKNKAIVDKKLVNRYYDKPQAPILLVPINDKRAAVAPDMCENGIGVFKPIT